jgi:protein TonB
MAELAKPPQPLVKVKPAYPIEARRLGIEGVVTFQVDIDATGAVKKVTLVKGLGHGCDQAAMEALWKTPFSPGIAPDGRAVPSQRYYPFGFDLNDVDAP